jgi:hypothetical protein
VGRLSKSAAWQTDYGGTPRKKNCSGVWDLGKIFSCEAFLEINPRESRISEGKRCLFDVLSVDFVRGREAGGIQT